MGQPLELAGSYLKTEEGNELHYYGGGGVAYDSTALACAGVPLAVRKGKTVGVWENGKVVEYCWHTDTSNTGLIKKTADVNLSAYQQKEEGKGLSTNDFNAAYKSKVDGIADQATKNDTDDNLKNRANHTGSQLANTISNFTSATYATVIAGLSAIAGTPVNGDSLNTIIGKFKYFADNFGLLVRGTTLFGFTKVNTPVTADDSVLSGIGKLQGQVDAYGAISRDFTISYQFPTTIWKDYFRKSEVVTDVKLDGVSVFSYSIDNGLSYETPTLPLTAATQFTIPAGTVVRWRITFANSVTVAMLNIKLK